MIIPVYKAFSFKSNFLLERPLPSKGKILVNENDIVKPWDKVGYCKATLKELIIPKEFKLQKKYTKTNIVKTGEIVARLKNKYLFTTFDGFLQDRGSHYVVISHPQDVFKVSGVYGNVFKVSASKSILVNTNGISLKFFAVSKPFVEGQLTVLPNPSELIEEEFMNRYVKDGSGLIIYSGDHLRIGMLKKAIEIGCTGVICGSCDRDTLEYAKENDFFVGIFSGFGRIPSYSKLYQILKKYDKQFVICLEGSEELFISTREVFQFSNNGYTEAILGLNVVILEYPYFGWEGEIIEIGDKSEIKVRVLVNGEVTKTNNFGIIALP
jgi:hypothetical protein